MSAEDGSRRSLRHVVAIGVELDVPGDFQVFLLALHLWDDHFDVSYATTEPHVSRRPGKAMFEDWTAEDDLGRNYAARNGGGGGGELRLMRRGFYPAVDEEAHRITLTLTDWERPVLTYSVPLPR